MRELIKDNIIELKSCTLFPTLIILLALILSGCMSAFKENEKYKLKASIILGLEPFFEENNLQPDIRKKLIDLRLERDLEWSEYVLKDNRSQNRKEKLNQILFYDMKISQLFSEEEYKAYKQYIKYESERRMINLAFHSIKLEKNRERQLLNALYNVRQNIFFLYQQLTQKGRLEDMSYVERFRNIYVYKETINKIYLESAKNILTAPQIQEFKRYLDKQYGTERMSIGVSQ